MSKVAIVYFSGFGHTAKQAEAVAKGASSVQGAETVMIRLADDGKVADGTWETLAEVDAIIYGSPTYMGGAAWQFKKFADESSKQWMKQAWKDTVAAGFTNSATVNGDKFSTIAYFITFSQQHGQLWLGTGLMPANAKANGPADTNWTGGYSGALSISPRDASPEEAPRAGDLESARLLGLRVATFVTEKMRSKTA